MIAKGEWGHNTAVLFHWYRTRTQGNGVREGGGTKELKREGGRGKEGREGRDRQKLGKWHSQVLASLKIHIIIHICKAIYYLKVMSLFTQAQNTLEVWRTPCMDGEPEASWEQVI